MILAYVNLRFGVWVRLAGASFHDKCGLISIIDFSYSFENQTSRIKDIKISSLKSRFLSAMWIYFKYPWVTVIMKCAVGVRWFRWSKKWYARSSPFKFFKVLYFITSSCSSRYCSSQAVEFKTSRIFDHSLTHSKTIRDYIKVKI